MKIIVLSALLCCSADLAAATKEEENGSPLAKVVELIDELMHTAVHEGEEDGKSYEKFTDYCEDRAASLSHALRLGFQDAEGHQATLSSAEATIEKLNAKIEKLAAHTSDSTNELNTATDLRKKETKTFTDLEVELVETIDTLNRAIVALSSKPSLLQMQSASNLAQMFSSMVQASVIGTSDAAKLTALLQASQGEEANDDEAFGAPAAAAYEKKSGNIVELMQDLKEKAETQLDAARQAETEKLHSYEKVKLTLQDEIRFATEDKKAATTELAAASETKSVASEELIIAKKKLRVHVAAKKRLHQDCMARSESFEVETQAQSREIDGLAKAKQVIEDAINKGSSSLAQLSFAQVAATLSSREDLANSGIVRLVRDLGHKHESKALVQLASKIAMAISSTSGEDVFGRVKLMIEDMIHSLKKKMSEEAEKQKYCENTLSETKERVEETQWAVERLTTKIERQLAKKQKIQGAIKDIQQELGELMKEDHEMDKLRDEDKDAYNRHKEKVQLEASATEKAMKLLSKHFSNSAQNDTAQTIQRILGDIHSQLSRWLAKLQEKEEQEQGEYTAQHRSNQVTETSLEEEKDYDDKEENKLQKSVVETSSEEDSTEEELTTVEAYFKQIQKDCRPKPLPYKEQQQKREDLVHGLKSALKALESQSLLQLDTVHRTLRGASQQRSMIAA